MVPLDHCWSQLRLSEPHALRAERLPHLRSFSTPVHRTSMPNSPTLAPTEPHDTDGNARTAAVRSLHSDASTRTPRDCGTRHRAPPEAEIRTWTQRRELRLEGSRLIDKQLCGLTPHLPHLGRCGSAIFVGCVPLCLDAAAVDAPQHSSTLSSTCPLTLSSLSLTAALPALPPPPRAGSVLPTHVRPCIFSRSLRRRCWPHMRTSRTHAPTAERRASTGDGSAPSCDRRRSGSKRQRCRARPWPIAIASEALSDSAQTQARGIPGKGGKS